MRPPTATLWLLCLTIAFPGTPRADEIPWVGCGSTVAEPACEPACDVACDAPAAPATFGGPLWTRTKLTGDWCGTRDQLAADGITLDVDSVLIYQGVSSGGLRREFEFGGHNDYLLNVDLGKLGVSQGTLFKFRAESRYGETVNGDSGALLPVATPLLFPAPEEVTAVTNFVITQFLSESFAVFAGKIDTLDGDANAYAHGRGKTQFLNTSFVVNPALFRVAPYSTYAAGFIMLDEGAVYTMSVYDPREYATRTDLDELFSEGVGITGEARIPVEFRGLPGHQTFGFAWSGRDYISTDQDFRFNVPALGGVPNRVSDSWGAYYNFDHALVVDPCDPNRHWGVFGRYGYADPEASPLEHFVSLGVGGASPFRRRPGDTFGAGWFYATSSNNLPGLLLGDNGQGTEFFYNVAVTPWFHLTADLQVLWPARNDVDNAVVPGLRALVNF
jgi:porin